jgi:hypothetical protein
VATPSAPCGRPPARGSRRRAPHRQDPLLANSPRRKPALASGAPPLPRAPRLCHSSSGLRRASRRLVVGWMISWVRCLRGGVMFCGYGLCR